MKNSLVQRALRVAMVRSWDMVKRGLVSKGLTLTINPNTYKFNTTTNNPITFNPCITPSHDIAALIQALPEAVTACHFKKKDGVYSVLNFPAWRDLDESTKPYFYQLALSELVTLSEHKFQLTPFTFVISHDLERTIQAQKRKRVDYLRTDCKKSLTRLLSAPKTIK